MTNDLIEKFFINLEINLRVE